MFKIQNLTNVRPPRDLGRQVITLPTKGSLKLTNEAAAHLGVTFGDHVGGGKAENGNCYIWKSPEGSTGGQSKIGKGSSTSDATFQFSSASIYAMLGGNTNARQHFSIAEEAEINEVNGVPTPTFLLTFEKESEKLAKVGKKAKAETAPVAAE